MSPATIHAGPDGRAQLGGWRYRPDPENLGLARGWERARFTARAVSVPHTPNGRAITGRRGARNFGGSVGWYRTELEVKEPGRYAIRFESVHHRATVWLDGRRLGAHIGAYLPWEVRPRLRPGRRHRLVVRVDWRSPAEMKRAGWHRGWFNYGGIHREVTLRRLGPSELEAPNVQTTVAPGPAGQPTAAVTVAVRVHNRGPARTIGARGRLVRAGAAIDFATSSERVPRGARRVLRARVEVPSAALWAPASPSLYDLELRVPGESGYRARVGLRELRVERGQTYLNDRPLFLYGASIHEDAAGRGDALTTADQDRLVEQLVAVGANATRAQHALHPALIERLDAAGILVWQEIGPWDSPGNWVAKTPAMRRRGVRRVRESLEQLQTHPSVLAWNLGNEVARNGHPGQRAFVDEAARLLHTEDPGRPVALDIWGVMLPRTAGPLYRRIDLIGATNYIGWYESPYASAAKIRRRISARVAYLRRLFPGKAIVATEFGAEGNSLNASTRHGGYDYQARLLRLHLDTYRSLPDAGGMLVWNLRDFGVNPEFAGGSIQRKVRGIRLVAGLNQKGLFDYRGAPKLAAEVAREEFGIAARLRG